MQERIRLAEWDNDNDPSVIKKIKEMNSTNWSSISQEYINSYILLLKLNLLSKRYIQLY